MTLRLLEFNETLEIFRGAIAGLSGPANSLLGCRWKYLAVRISQDRKMKLAQVEKNSNPGACGRRQIDVPQWRHVWISRKEL